MTPYNRKSMLHWINTASYEELLYRKRHTPRGSVWFQGEIGQRFRERLHEKYQLTSAEEVLAIDERVGWPSRPVVVTSPGPMEGAHIPGERDDQGN